MINNLKFTLAAILDMQQLHGRSLLRFSTLYSVSLFFLSFVLSLILSEFRPMFSTLLSPGQAQLPSGNLLYMTSSLEFHRLIMAMMIIGNGLYAVYIKRFEEQDIEGKIGFGSFFKLVPAADIAIFSGIVLGYSLLDVLVQGMMLSAGSGMSSSTTPFTVQILNLSTYLFGFIPPVLGMLVVIYSDRSEGTNLSPRVYKTAFGVVLLSAFCFIGIMQNLSTFILKYISLILQIFISGIIHVPTPPDWLMILFSLLILLLPFILFAFPSAGIMRYSVKFERDKHLARIESISSTDSEPDTESQSKSDNQSNSI